ncbi:hypothetical protein KW797_02325 [Candidatus Parcubacteria bacterium]|nr:hypothetical protein [Candidatus Parcubacteria bacterium]
MDEDDSDSVTSGELEVLLSAACLKVLESFPQGTSLRSLMKEAELREFHEADVASSLRQLRQSGKLLGTFQFNVWQYRLPKFKRSR